MDLDRVLTKPTDFVDLNKAHWKEGEERQSPLTPRCQSKPATEGSSGEMVSESQSGQLGGTATGASWVSQLAIIVLVFCEAQLSTVVLESSEAQ